MGMVNKRIEKNETDNAKMEQSMASGQAMMSLSDNYGEQGQNFKMSLGKALEDTKGNPDKMSGAVMAHAAEFENMQKQQLARDQYTQALNLAKQKAALGIGGGGGSSPMFSVDVADGVDINQ
jgi:Tfp pilus assembly protein PilF